jgi:hypothetical protein
MASQIIHDQADGLMRCGIDLVPIGDGVKPKPGRRARSFIVDWKGNHRPADLAEDADRRSPLPAVLRVTASNIPNGFRTVLFVEPAQN